MAVKPSLNEENIDEAKLSASQRDRLDSLILNVMMTTAPDYYGNDTPQKYLKAIEKEFGAKIAKQVDDGSYQMHFGRDNESSGHDKLASRQWSSKFKGGPRVTAAGKMNKQDVGALKTRIKNDKKFGGLLKSVKLPEEVELDEISKKTLGSYVKKASKSADTHFDKAGMALAKAQDAGERASKSDTDRGYDYHKDREAKHYQAFRANDLIHRKRAAGVDRAKDRLAEEVEELDELKKSTLASYVKKAAGDAVTKAYRAGDVRDKDSGKNYMKALGRQIGISTATSKLAKEEVELDESWSDGVSSRNAPMHARDAAKHRRNAQGSSIAAQASNKARDSSGYNKHMAAYHSSLAKALKSSYHAGEYGTASEAKRDHKYHMSQAKEYKSKMSEEVELDELKKSTLASYVTKAAYDTAAHAARFGADQKTKKGGSSFVKAHQRLYGIKKASDKLAKEEVELDEVSTATLQRYKSAASKAMDRASDSAIDKMLGSKDSQSVDISKEKKTMDKRSKGVSLASKKLTKEEVENLDELKKSTLGSYVKRAAGSMAGKTAVAAAQASSSMKKSSPDITRGIVNRMKGITRATDKLTKEEVELDEVSDKKLDAYRQKAFADQPAGDDGSDKYRKRKFGRDLAFSKQTGRAKVLATKEEEADLEEKLVGGQKKLDHNKNGKIDSHDFHLMRKKKMKEEVEGLDEISRDLARRYIRKIADKTNTGELSVKQVEKRRPGLNLAGKKAYPSIAGEPKVRATD